jgi:UDP-N-acetyl-2-amino-2-deoxyglucuronate dehydrogenase
MAQSPAAGELRVGVIGCGAIAHNHVRALQGMAGVRVTAVMDTVLERARELAKTYDIGHAFADLDDLLRSGLDAVTVCTPNGDHEAGVLAAARHGLHVLCEKPIALTLAGANRMVAATTEAGVRLGVLFQRRFWPAAARIRAALDEGRLGPPISGAVVARLNRDAAYYAEPWRGRWATEGGGVLMTQAIHHVDLLQWFMGPARRVTGRVATLARAGVIEVEDTASAIVEFDSGGLATIQVGTTFNPGLGAQVWVSDAQGRTASVVEFPEGIGSTELSTIPGDTEFTDVFGARGAYDLPLGEVHAQLVPYHTIQIQDFVHAVREDRAPAVTGAEAVKSLEIVQAIYESSRTGRPVELTRGS